MNENSELINDSVSKLEMSEILGIIGVIIGVVGIIIAIIIHIKSKKKEELYTQIFEAASDKLDIEKTSKEINLKKTKLNSLKNELKIIKDAIPIEAQKAILKDKIENTKYELNKYHKEAIKLNDKLLKLKNTDIERIPDSLFKSIQSFIEPKYELKDRIDSKKTLLTIMTTIASISLLLAKNMIGYYFGTFSFILAIPIIISLSLDYVKLQKISNSQSLLKNDIWLNTSIILIYIFVWLVSISFILNRSNNNIEEKIFIALFFIGLFIIPFGIFRLVKKIRKYKNQYLIKSNVK